PPFCSDGRGQRTVTIRPVGITLVMDLSCIMYIRLRPAQAPERSPLPTSAALQDYPIVCSMRKSALGTGQISFLARKTVAWERAARPTSVVTGRLQRLA